MAPITAPSVHKNKRPFPRLADGIEREHYPFASDALVLAG
jgi:hypothetical protein